jgi:proliferating cell nuclear antigen PCNA|uniref:Proliferating cell nuclear antigen PCNA N-terminal domain-containing protein n=1 Tax=viral metagenome TaxID=1070528 RepID=A0A6C0H0A1_9ZZZZ
MNSNLIFRVKTIQSRVIKILIESLKDLLYEVNFIFSKEGIKMNACNTSNTATICMDLKAENFEEFYCKQTKKIGISMKSLYNHIKNMSDDETLTFFYENDNKLGIRFENSKDNSVAEYKLILMEIPDSDQFDIPDFDFSIISIIPSVKFHKIIKDLNVVHDMIEIRSVNGVMSFSGKGEQSHGQVTLMEADDNEPEEKKKEKLVFKKKNNSIYQGRFSLKNMMILYKCTSLCSNVELYLENDTPLFIKYNIGRLGHTYLILAPVIEDVTKLEADIQVDDEEDEES